MMTSVTFLRLMLCLTIFIVSTAAVGDRIYHHASPIVCSLLLKSSQMSYQEIRKHCGHFLSTKYHSRSRLRQHDQMPEGLRSHTEESEAERSTPKFPRALRDDVQVPRAKTFRPEYSLIRRLASALQERYQRDEEDLWTAEEDPQLEDSENQDIEKESITDHYYDHSSPLYLIRKWYNRIESD